MLCPQELSFIDYPLCLPGVNVTSRLPDDSLTHPQKQVCHGLDCIKNKHQLRIECLQN